MDKDNNNPIDGNFGITDNLKKEILQVRDTGQTNMFDVIGVSRIAFDLDFFDLVIFLQDEKNYPVYMEFILHGNKAKSV